MPTAEVLQDMPTRLRAAAAAVRDTKTAYDLALEGRDELVVEAIDDGMSQMTVADAIGVKKGRISAILANSQPDED